MANKTDRWSKWERLPEKMKRHFHVCRCGRGWFDLTKTRPPRGVKSVKFIGRRRRNGRPAIDLICRADLIVAHHKPNLIFDIFPGKKKPNSFPSKDIFRGQYGCLFTLLDLHQIQRRCDSFIFGIRFKSPALAFWFCVQRIQTVHNIPCFLTFSCLVRQVCLYL